MSRDSAELGTNEEEETDLVSILASQGADTEIEDDEEAGEVPSDPEELKAYVKELQERISKRNKSLRKAKDAQHRTEREREELLKRFEQVETRLNTIGQPTQGAEKSEQIAREWVEKAEIEPGKTAIEYADWKQEQLEGKLANYLGGELNALRAEIAALKGATNPEMLQYKTEIDMLKGNPKLAGLGEDVLLTLAKGLKGASVRKPRGSIGGQRAGASGAGKLSKEEEASIREAVRNA